MLIIKCNCGANLKISEAADLNKISCPRCGLLLRAKIGNEGGENKNVLKSKKTKMKFKENKKNIKISILLCFLVPILLVLISVLVYNVLPERKKIVEPIDEWKFVLNRPNNFLYVHMDSAGAWPDGGVASRKMLGQILTLFTFISDSKIPYILKKIGIDENSINKFIWSYENDGVFSSVAKIVGKIDPLFVESKLEAFDIVKDNEKIKYFENKKNKEIEKIRNTPIRDLFVPGNKTINQLETEMIELNNYTKILEKKNFSEFEVENIGGTDLYRKKNESIYLFADPALDKVVLSGYKNITQVLNVDKSGVELDNEVYSDCKSGKYFVIFLINQKDNPIGKEYYKEVKSLLYLRPILDFKNLYVKMRLDSGGLVVSINLKYDNKKDAELAVKWIKELPRTLPVIFGDPKLAGGFDQELLFFAEKISGSNFLINDKNVQADVVIKKIAN